MSQCTLYKRYEKRMAHLSTSSLNLTISRSIFQKYGFNAFFFWANKPENPFLLPHSQPLPWSKLTENDISDNSMSIPRFSKNSIIFGYVTCSWSQYPSKSINPTRKFVTKPTTLFTHDQFAKLWLARTNSRQILL